MPADEFAFGDRVTFSNCLSRHVQWREGARLKVWVSFPCPARAGIVIGRRTLANGRSEWEGEEVGYEFYVGNAERFTAYLVAYGMHRRPVLVMPEDLEPVVDRPDPVIDDDLDMDPLFDVTERSE